jgi:RinA family phage transcriptional activator
MRYKYTLKYAIRSTVEWQLRNFRQEKRQLEKYKAELIPSGVQGYSLTAGVDGGEAKRSTEEVAMRIAETPYIKRIETTVAAIDKVIRSLDKKELHLVELVYWRQEYNIEGAALIVGFSRSAAYRHINRILAEIAYQMGYIKEI